MARPRPAVLCVLDGWGHRPDPRYNAILDARTPNYDWMIAHCPQALIDASETFVGLPKGQMGNSEVGHMNLGAGRVAVPELPRIDKAIADGSLVKNPILAELIDTLKQTKGACHLLGLASPGGVHSHQDHLVALANMIAGAGVPVWIHALLDGRDMPPRSALECLKDMQTGLKRGLPIRFATVGGRYYGMDRDKRWDRVALAYAAIVDAKGEPAKTAEDAVDKGYAADLGDEFVLPTVIEGYSGMKDGDAVLMFNFRADRAREILTALLDPRFDGFNRSRVVKFAMAVGMVEYSAALNPFLKTLYPPETLKMGLGETVSKAAGPTPVDMQAGEAKFLANCAACHGQAGVGTAQGPPLVHKIYEPNHHGDAAFQRAVANGVRAHHWEFGNMPKLDSVTPADVEQIVQYVRWLQRQAGIF